MTCFLKVFFSDKLESVRDVLKGEDFAKEYSMIEMSSGMSSWLKFVLGGLLSLCGQRRAKKSLDCSNALSAGEYRRLTY